MAFLCQAGSSTSTTTINLPEYFEQPIKDLLLDAKSAYKGGYKPYGAYEYETRTDDDGTEYQALKLDEHGQPIALKDADGNPISMPRIAGLTPEQQALATEIMGSYDPETGQLTGGFSGFSDDINTAIGSMFDDAGNWKTSNVTADTVGADKWYDTMSVGTGEFDEAGNEIMKEVSMADQYMNPYIDAVAGKIETDIREQAAYDDQARKANAVGKGAFGGSRDQALAQKADSDMLDRIADTKADLMYKGYTDAQTMFGKDADRQTTADRYSGALGLEADKLNAVTDLNALGALGSLAGQGQNLYTGEMALKGGIADQDQRLNQAGLDLAYNDWIRQSQYPFDQINWYSGIMQGLQPGIPQSTSVQSPAPSPAQQILGLGINALGMYGAGGGFSPGGFSFGNMWS